MFPHATIKKLPATQKPSRSFFLSVFCHENLSLTQNAVYDFAPAASARIFGDCESKAIGYWNAEANVVLKPVRVRFDDDRPSGKEKIRFGDGEGVTDRC